MATYLSQLIKVRLRKDAPVQNKAIVPYAIHTSQSSTPDRARDWRVMYRGSTTTPTSKSVHDKLTRNRFEKVRISRVRAKARRNNVLHETPVIKPSALIIQVETAVTRADMLCGKPTTVWKLQLTTFISSVTMEVLREGIVAALINLQPTSLATLFTSLDLSTTC